MRRLFTFICFCLFTTTIQSQSAQFSSDMNIVVKAFDAATNAKEYQAVYLSLEPIAKAYPTEWLPLYYMSLVKTRMSMQKMGNADDLANQSIQLIERAKKIQVNDELLCAESLAFTAKMSVSPYTRWLKYENRIKSPLSLAKKINKDNPRIYALEASLQYNMPVLLGGGCTSSYALALTAIEKLSIPTRQIVPFILPHWGGDIAHKIIKDCKKD